MLKCWYWLRPSHPARPLRKVLRYGTGHSHLAHRIARHAAISLVCTVVGTAGIGTTAVLFSNQDNLPIVTDEARDAPPVRVPEPASAGVFAVGLIGFVALRQRRGK